VPEIPRQVRLVLGPVDAFTRERRCVALGVAELSNGDIWIKSAQ
jgi:hypothetical protein